MTNPRDSWTGAGTAKRPGPGPESRPSVRRRTDNFAADALQSFEHPEALRASLSPEASTASLVVDEEGTMSTRFRVPFLAVAVLALGLPTLHLGCADDGEEPFPD